MAAFKVAAFDRFPDWRACCPGGNAMNQSVHFRQMGWDASFVGALGNDREGELLLRALAAYGIDCRQARILEGKTAGNTLLVDQFGERFEAPGAWQGGVGVAAPSGVSRGSDSVGCACGAPIEVTGRDRGG